MISFHEEGNVLFLRLIHIVYIFYSLSKKKTIFLEKNHFIKTTYTSKITKKYYLLIFELLPCTYTYCN